MLLWDDHHESAAQATPSGETMARPSFGMSRASVPTSQGSSLRRASRALFHSRAFAFTSRALEALELVLFRNPTGKGTILGVGSAPGHSLTFLRLEDYCSWYSCPILQRPALMSEAVAATALAIQRRRVGESSR